MTPSEQQALYEANVDKIAEEMARADVMHSCTASDHPDDFNPNLKRQEWFDSLMESEKDIWVTKNKPAARVALKHMAEEADEAYKQGRVEYEEKGSNLVADYLQSRGLVPAKGQE